MTELRDARLQKALDSAPDGDQRPPALVADAIRAAAHRAVAPAAAKPAPAPWWQTFWDALGSPRSPWGAALATVVLGVLITALWVREPVPDAVPVASSPAPVSEPAAAPSVSPHQPPADSQALPAQPSTPPAQAVHAPPVVAPKPAMPEVATAERKVAPTAPAPAPAEALPATPEVARKDAAADLSNRLAAGDAAPVVTAPVPAPAAAAPAAALSRAPAAAPAAKATATESGLGPWTAVDIAMDGRTATLDAQQAQALVRQVQALEGRLQVEKTATDYGPGAPDLQLTMRVQDRTVATLTVRGNNLRWQRERRLTLVGPLDDAQLQQIMQLAREALAGNNNPRSTP